MDKFERRVMISTAVVVGTGSLIGVVWVAYLIIKPVFWWAMGG